MSSPVEQAVAVLRVGGLVAFPTETVYGLGADALNKAAVGRVFVAKGRTASRALTIAFAPQARFEEWAHVDDLARRLMGEFWPGPLTLVLPRTARVSPLITGGQETVGLRVPDHPLALAMLEAFAGGVVAPSANSSGLLSPTTAAHVRSDLGEKVDFILDGGACPLGLESTVLSLVGVPQVLRRGAIPTSLLEERLDCSLAAPEMVTEKHFAPHTSLEVVDKKGLARILNGADRRWAVLAFDPPPTNVSSKIKWVLLPSDPVECGRLLYDTFRKLDSHGFDGILVSALPEGPQWEALSDRLNDAARFSPSFPSH
ncbi:MAG: threonylcarbamoyl-AMP synthase [Proteobacteria bacterium]|jgi:L-threonylcarbamoyladenylate synthase|nr:threonylcarbamoyl-AMP synthase [Pseudomonadota bacterium]